MDLKVLIDADWVGSIDNRKRTSGGTFFLGKRPVSWTSKKKNCTSQSTTKVEYVARIVNYSNIVSFKQLLEGMRIVIKGPIVIYCDNTSAINISNNLVTYHFLRELVQDKEVKFEYVNTKE